jgi:hypothetical protein
VKFDMNKKGCAKCFISWNWLSVSKPLWRYIGYKWPHHTLHNLKVMCCTQNVTVFVHRIS